MAKLNHNNQHNKRKLLRQRKNKIQIQMRKNKNHNRNQLLTKSRLTLMLMRTVKKKRNLKPHQIKSNKKKVSTRQEKRKSKEIESVWKRLGERENLQRKRRKKHSKS